MSQIALQTNNFESKFLNTSSEPKQKNRFVHIDPSYYNKKDVKAGVGPEVDYVGPLIAGIAIMVTLVAAVVAAFAVFNATASLAMAGMTFAIVAAGGLAFTYFLTKNIR